MNDGLELPIARAAREEIVLRSEHDRIVSDLRAENELLKAFIRRIGMEDLLKLIFASATKSCAECDCESPPDGCNWIRAR